MGASWGGWREGRGDHDLAMASRWVEVIRHVHVSLLETAPSPGPLQGGPGLQGSGTSRPVFAANAKAQVRYKILVLDGLSGMGGQDAVHRFFRANLCGARGSPEAE